MDKIPIIIIPDPRLREGMLDPESRDVVDFKKITGFQPARERRNKEFFNKH